MNKETIDFINDSRFDDLYNNGLPQKFKSVGRGTKSEILTAIGELVVAFQKLEHNIKFFVGILAGIGNNQPLIHALLSRHSFSNLLLILGTVAIQVGFEEIENLQFLIKKAGKAEEIRNHFVHSDWAWDTRIKSKLKSSKDVQHDFESYADEGLLQIAEMVKKINTAMQALEYDWLRKKAEEGVNIPGCKIL